MVGIAYALDLLLTLVCFTEILDEVYEIISNWDKDKIINAYLEAPQKGFNTQLMGKDLLYWAYFIKFIKKGLENRDILNKHEKNETYF